MRSLYRCLQRVLYSLILMNNSLMKAFCTIEHFSNARFQPSDYVKILYNLKPFSNKLNQM